MYTFAQEGGRLGEDLTEEINQFLDFLVDDLLVSSLAAENKFINIFEMFKLIQYDSKIGGKSVLEGCYDL